MDIASVVEDDVAGVRMHDVLGLMAVQGNNPEPHTVIEEVAPGSLKIDQREHAPRTTPFTRHPRRTATRCLSIVLPGLVPRVNIVGPFRSRDRLCMSIRRPASSKTAKFIIIYACPSPFESRASSRLSKGGAGA